MFLLPADAGLLSPITQALAWLYREIPTGVRAHNESCSMSPYSWFCHPPFFLSLAGLLAFQHWLSSSSCHVRSLGKCSGSSEPALVGSHLCTGSHQLPCQGKHGELTAWGTHFRFLCYFAPCHFMLVCLFCPISQHWHALIKHSHSGAEDVNQLFDCSSTLGKFLFVAVLPPCHRQLTVDEVHTSTTTLTASEKE